MRAARQLVAVTSAGQERKKCFTDIMKGARVPLPVAHRQKSHFPIGIWIPSSPVGPQRARKINSLERRDAGQWIGW